MTKIFSRVSHIPGLRSVVRTLSNRRGVAALEYGLVAALVAVIVISSIGKFGDGLDTTMTNIGSRLTTEAGKITGGSGTTK